jgi:hypothetical protein
MNINEKSQKGDESAERGDDDARDRKRGFSDDIISTSL